MLIFVLAVLQAALDGPVVREERRVAALKYLLPGQHGNLAVTSPVQGLRVQGKPPGIERAARVDRTDLSLERGRQARIARGSERFRRIGEYRSRHDLALRAAPAPADPGENGLPGALKRTKAPGAI